MSFYKTLLFSCSLLLRDAEFHPFDIFMLDCFDVIATKGREIQINWRIEDIENNLQCSSIADTDVVTCCYTTSIIYLTCLAAGGKGWKGGYVTINEKQYCHESVWLSGQEIIELNTTGRRILPK